MDLLLHTMVAAVSEQANGYRVLLCEKGGLKTVYAKRIVDATGDADVTGLANLPRTKSEVLQSGTLINTIGGYDFDTIDPNQIETTVNAALQEFDLPPFITSGFIHSSLCNRKFDTRFNRAGDKISLDTTHNGKREIEELDFEWQ